MSNEGDHYLYRVLIAKVEEIRKAEQGVQSMYSGFSEEALEVLRGELLDVMESYEIVVEHRGEEMRQSRGPSLFTADAVVELARKLDVSPINKATKRYLRNRFEEVKETGTTVADVFVWVKEAPQLSLIPRTDETQKPKL